MSPHISVLVLALVFGLPIAGVAAEPAAEAGFEASVKPFLAKSCTVCHNPSLKNGSLDLVDANGSAASVARDPGTWEKVIEKMRTGQMPPPGLARPSDAEVAAVTGWIEGEIERAEQQAPPDPGRVTARRLNRTEYNNTVRDLLGVDLRPADDFPQDDAGYGFDNIADVLSLSPVLMERYLAAAERVSRAALFGPEGVKPTMVRLQARTGKIEPSPTPLFDYDRTGLSLPNAFHALHRFPVDGEYLIRLIPGGTRPLGSDPVRIAVWMDGGLVETFAINAEEGASFDQDRPDLNSKIRELRLRVTAGEHWLAGSILGLYEGLPASYGGPSPSSRPMPVVEFRPRVGASPEKIEESRKRFEERRKEIVPVNEARVSRFDVVGPFEPVPGPSARTLESVYVCGHRPGVSEHRPGCARTIVAHLARRAYRRPVTAHDVDPLVGLVTSARREGESFDEGLALALQAMLVSPDFLFRIEHDQEAERGKSGPPPVVEVGEYELASRLSYFLWASMPDEELLRAAERKALGKPAVLAAQVTRMLKDPKAGALVQAFGGQWLQFRALESASPDRDRFPGFDNNLRLSMRRETEMFLESVVREDRSILDLIDGKYSFLNERLARHYGVTGVTGPEFRKVDLTFTTRSGVLTQASVLTVSSYPNRTSPVLRGKWILENLLNAPPPDPPAGVPRLDEATVGAAASLRQQLEAHRSNATCASCHSKMDPLGFSLEHYDAVGAWREQDGKFAIDTAGTLPDGRSFAGPDEMKAILRADREAFAEGVTHKLLTYALGRGLERYDRRTVKAIARRAAESDYRFSALVLGIVESLPFQKRRGERTAS